MSGHRELWQLEAERAGGTHLADVLTEMRDGQRDMVARLDTLIKGFPGGDIDGHRRYHESVIEHMELRNRLVREALVKVVQAGALAGFGWLAVALWRAFKFSLTQ